MMKLKCITLGHKWRILGEHNFRLVAKCLRCKKVELW